MAGHALGIDHLVVAVRDLDAAREAYAALGFTLTARGRHSPPMGTGKHCIMFGRDDVELLGVLTPTELNRPFRSLLERGRGRSGLRHHHRVRDTALSGIGRGRPLGQNGDKRTRGGDNGWQAAEVLRLGL